MIEHLPDVEAALLGFCAALKRNGLILIGAPNPNSLSGVVTKYSPHSFHIWFYRNVRGDQKAGLPGGAPAPLVAAAVDFVLEGLCAQKKISRSEERGYAAAETAPRRAPRRDEPSLDEEIRMPTGKKKYYN